MEKLLKKSEKATNDQDTVKLFQLAKLLGNELQKSQIFCEFKQANKKMQNDNELQKNLLEFNNLRVNASDLMYKTDSESRKNYNDLDKKIKALYEKIWKNENMVDFNRKNSSLLELTQKLLNIITIASDGVDLSDETAYDENFLTPERKGFNGCQPGTSCNTCTSAC